MSDTIYRNSVLATIGVMYERCDGDVTDYRDLMLEAVKVLPSADKPQGKWVLDPNGMDWNIPAWRCSRCGFVANYIGTETNGLGRNPMNWAGSKYCPNCGAEMKGVDDEHNK